MFGSPSSIDQNVILTGYIGPAQLSVARKVAERLKMPFVDFGLRFEERAEMPADEMRALYGDSRTRALESELLDEVALFRGTVIHVSGQILLHGDHYAVLNATGPVICLVATLDAVLQRLHLALGARYHNPQERSLALGTLQREWAVRSQAGICEIDTSAMDDSTIVDSVVLAWRTQTGVIDWRP